MFSLQTQSKASTISSGARAAAATLNVPIERLEAQIHQHSNSHSPNSDKPHMNGHDENNIILEHNIRETSVSPSNFQNLHHPINSGLNNSGQHKNSTSSQQEIIVREDESSPTQTSLTKHSLLQFAIQHFRNE
jgi:myosin XV